MSNEPFYRVSRGSTMYQRVASCLLSWFRSRARPRLASASAWLGVTISGCCLLVAAWTLAASSRPAAPNGGDASITREVGTSVPLAEGAPEKSLVVDVDNDRPGSETKLSLGDQLK